MSIENGISTLPHSSGVLCIGKGYSVSVKQMLKNVQSLVIYTHKYTIFDIIKVKKLVEKVLNKNMPK